MVHSAKLVHQRLDKRGKVRVDGAVFHRSVASFSEEQVGTVSQFGIPRSPVVFCNRAVKCGHPRCMSLHLPEVVTQVLRDNLEMEPAELALVRCRQLARWAVRAKQLGEANSNSSGICLSTCRYSGQKRVWTIAEGR